MTSPVPAVLKRRETEERRREALRKAPRGLWREADGWEARPNLTVGFEAFELVVVAVVVADGHPTRTTRCCSGAGARWQRFEFSDGFSRVKCCRLNYGESIFLKSSGRI
jgi:hypothetical protein